MSKEALKPLREIFGLVSKYSRRLEKNDWKKLLDFRRVVASKINESKEFKKSYAIKRDLIRLLIKIDSIYLDFLFYMSSYDWAPNYGQNPLAEDQYSDMIDELIDSYKLQYNIF